MQGHYFSRGVSLGVTCCTESGASVLDALGDNGVLFLSAGAEKWECLPPGFCSVSGESVQNKLRAGSQILCLGAVPNPARVWNCCHC